MEPQSAPERNQNVSDGLTAPDLTTDVVVVGARCAGSATAMLLAQAGHEVVVVDRSAHASDTLSTHGIARTGMVQLQRWGLLDQVVESGAPAIHEVVFHTEGGHLSRTIKDRSGVDFLVAPRRCVLDSVIQGAATEAGARVMHGVTVDGVCRSDDGRATGIYGRFDGSPIRIDAKIVVGADGLRSRVARSVGAEFTEERPAVGATHYSYFSGDWSAIEYYSGSGGFAGIFPTHDAEACVWICTGADFAEDHRHRCAGIEQAYDAMLANIAPDLHARTVGRDDVNRGVTRGMLRLPNHLRRPVGPGWALVGDAGYHRDAITGHGISDAFRDAELLARSLDQMLRGEVSEAEGLGRYHDERDRMLRDIFELTIGLAQLPPADEFRSLQKQLAVAIEAQASELAALPPIRERAAALSH